MERPVHTQLAKPLLSGLLIGGAIFASMYVIYNLHALNLYEIYMKARFLIVEIQLEGFPLPIWFFWPLPLAFSLLIFAVSYFYFELSEALALPTASFLTGILCYYAYETIRLRQLISSVWWHEYFLQSIVITSVLWLVFLFVGGITGFYTRQKILAQIIKPEP